jgi:hypothetical protein
MLDMVLGKGEFHILLRKVMEVFNFYQAHLPPKEQEVKEDDEFKFEAKGYPFCFKVMLDNPTIMLYRNSLSNERLVGEADSLVLHNISDEKASEHNYHEKFFTSTQED